MACSKCFTAFLAGAVLYPRRPRYNQCPSRCCVAHGAAAATADAITTPAGDKIMAEITRSFISHAASYGFTLKEISSYLSELKRGE